VSDNHSSPSIAHTILEGIGACSGWGYGMFSHINLSDTSSTRLIIVSQLKFYLPWFKNSDKSAIISSYIDSIDLSALGW
jgi:hypothetical protein